MKTVDAIGVEAAARRAEPKEVLCRPSSTEAERAAAREELRRRPRDASATRVRVRNRDSDSDSDSDSDDGRPRGYLRAFGGSRVNLREQAHAGFLPGVRKSSWWTTPSEDS
ncbi:30S ribosomal protein S14 [Streptomyces sp. NPDC096311]|uniref:30S ribosomal protein S14 n=1 Tax=Streptomyces sp. NPDC096311 TaxID=3366083 RepID=UPI0038133FF2